MNNKQEELANLLEEYATYIRIDGNDGRAKAYDRAAYSVKSASYLPPNPADIEGIGDTIRTTIAQWQRSGEIEELKELKEQYDWYKEIKDVDGIGPARAQQLHDKLRVDSIDDLLLVAKEGDLTMIDGIGPATANKIQESARNL